MKKCSTFGTHGRASIFGYQTLNRRSTTVRTYPIACFHKRKRLFAHFGVGRSKYLQFIFKPHHIQIHLRCGDAGFCDFVHFHHRIQTSYSVPYTVQSFPACVVVHPPLKLECRASRRKSSDITQHLPRTSIFGMLRATRDFSIVLTQSPLQVVRTTYIRPAFCERG